MKSIKTELIFPNSKYVSIKLLLDYEENKKFLKENSIDLPIIIKFQSERKEICHQMVLVITDNGLKNLPEFVKNFDLNNTFCVVQKFANHGGCVLKLYRFNNGSKTYCRPSIPDMFEYYETKFEEFNRGYFTFKTEELLSNRILNLLEAV